MKLMYCLFGKSYIQYPRTKWLQQDLVLIRLNWFAGLLLGIDVDDIWELAYITHTVCFQILKKHIHLFTMLNTGVTQLMTPCQTIFPSRNHLQPCFRTIMGIPMQMTELLAVPTHLAVSLLLKTLRLRKICMVSTKDMVGEV